VAIVPPKFCLLEHGNVNGYTPLHLAAHNYALLSAWPWRWATGITIIIVYFHFISRALMNT